MRAVLHLAAIGGLLLAGCGAPRPFALDLGHEPCDHCHMTLTDTRFAAELVTRTGREFRFDDIGCLAAFLADSGWLLADGGAAWVSDFQHPGHWLRSDSAIYLRTAALHTPMASGVIALAGGGPVDSLAAALAATRLDWTGLPATTGPR
ncbi:MAG: hypothetical protein ABJC74_00650 [Gemmatimonadota bacterium]